MNMNKYDLSIPYIAASGDASIFVQPDIAVVTFGVEAFHKEIIQAKGINDERASKLVAAIKAVGVEDNNIQTQTMTLDVVYPPQQHRPYGAIGEEIQGYSTKRVYVITLKDIDLLEKLIDSALVSGANRLHGIEYKDSNLRKHRDEARRMAAKAAREKAELFASELGVKVGKPLVIEEVPFMMRAPQQNAVFSSNSAYGQLGQTTLVGQIEVTASLNVRFSLE